MFGTLFNITLSIINLSKMAKTKCTPCTLPSRNSKKNVFFYGNELSSITATLGISTNKLLKISTTKVKNNCHQKLNLRNHPAKPNLKTTNPVTVHLHINQRQVNLLHHPGKIKMLPQQNNLIKVKIFL